VPWTTPRSSDEVTGSREGDRFEPIGVDVRRLAWPNRGSHVDYRE
jgi:hypothetical protein